MTNQDNHTSDRVDVLFVCPKLGCNSIVWDSYPMWTCAKHNAFMVEEGETSGLYRLIRLVKAKMYRITHAR